MKLTLTQAKKDIAAGALAPAYILTGDDVYSKKDLIALIKKRLNPDEFNFFSEDGSSVDMGDFLSSANSSPVFSDARMAVLNNADKLRKGTKAVEALAAYLADPMPTTCFILCHNDAAKLKKDKTLPDAAADNCVIIDFPPLSGAQLATWIAAKFKEEGLSAGQEEIAMLDDLIGGDLIALSTEIEKLSLLLAEREDKKVNQEDILSSVGFSKEENPFALSNAMMDLNKTAALKLVDNMLAAREEPTAILNKISGPVVKMLKIKRLALAGYGQQDIIRLGGLFPWEGRLAGRAGSMPPAAMLTKALNKIIEADMAFKSSQSIDAAVTLKGIILTALAK